MFDEAGTVELDSVGKKRWGHQNAPTAQFVILTRGFGRVGVLFNNNNVALGP